MPDADPKVTPWAKMAVILEVVFVFALLHVTYRTIKHFSPLGRIEGSLGVNLTPGLAMIAFTFIAVWLHRRAWRDYGLMLADWPRHISLALCCIFVAIAVVGPPLMLLSPHHDARWAPATNVALIGTLGNFAAALLFLLVMRRDPAIVTRWPPYVTLPLVAVIAASPVIAAVCRDKQVEAAALEALWLFIGAGFGEELFFRAYVQSHVDLACGRPWSVLGTRLGPGILLSAVLFGMIHVLNPVDYFHDRFDFAWRWFPSTFAAGILLGCIRAKSGSVLPCAVIHALGDIVGVIPRWMG